MKLHASNFMLSRQPFGVADGPPPTLLLVLLLSCCCLRGVGVLQCRMYECVVFQHSTLQYIAIAMRYFVAAEGSLDRTSLVQHI